MAANDAAYTITPLTRVSRLVDSVTDQLRDLILTGGIPPGTHLLQVEMAQRLGVSRTPLREAFRILEREGLVRVSNGNNTIQVVDFTPKEIQDLYELREVVDGLAARLAAQRGLPPKIDRELQRHLDQMEVLDSAESSPTAPTAVPFHTLITQAAGNSHLDSLAPFLRMSSLLLARRVEAADGGLLHDAHIQLADDKADHRAIYEAIIARDPEAAEEAARRHMRVALRTWTSYFGEASSAAATRS
jgi:DNA-binding GntR family transcriptional regulator